MERSGITTLVMYHPMRPVDCLIRALDSLKAATTRRHRVEVVVQGPCDISLPPEDAFGDSMRLVYIRNGKNRGNSQPMNVRSHAWMNEAVDKTDFWFKMDDDFVLPSNGLDLLIEAIEAERALGQYKIGSACIGTPGNNPMLISTTGKVFRRNPGVHETRVERFGQLEWVIADFVHNGATIYTREAFQAGCTFDSTYFVGGEHVDMALQMHKAGFKCLATTVPVAEHRNAQCTSQDYLDVRMDRKQIIHSYQYFVSKWGLKNPRLAKSAGFIES